MPQSYRFFVHTHLRPIALVSWLVLWPACYLFAQDRTLDAKPGLTEFSKQFVELIEPTLRRYCVECHAADAPEADLDLSGFQQLDDVLNNHAIWSVVLDRVQAGEMPPADAEQMSDSQRQMVVDWITAVLRIEAERTAGDPGPVLARRLSNAEFDNCLRDLTGVDLRPARDFPVDPANAAGFNNSGESLSMSPALLNKYLLAARSVSEHMVFAPHGIDFAPHPVVTDTDRDKYCVNRIVAFYQRQPIDLADYFYAAWRLQQVRGAQHTLAQIAADQRLSVRYLQLIWDALQTQPQRGGPWDTLHAHWRDLASQANADNGVTPPTPSQARTACEQMRDYVLEVRKQFEPHFDNLNAKGIHKGSQPFVLWKNKQYAEHRRMADLSRLAADAYDGQNRDDLQAACDSFCALFPDSFYILERGRDYLDTPKDEQEKGRLLSAGFHSMMGYFRDDRPLMELILDEAGQQELDQLWQELEFFAGTPQRQYQGFLWFERTDSNTMRDAEFDFARPEDKQALTEPYIQKLAEVYLGKAQRLGAGPTEIMAIEDFFRDINQQIRAVEKARERAEGAQLQSVVDFANRAFRRSLSTAQAAELSGFYQQLRQQEQLTHEEALQDCLVSVLLSPKFCYRLDLRSEGEQPQALDDYELASRLSFFLWASTPDEELLQLAAAGQLHQPEILRSQTQRMLQDPRIRGLALEFAANWLDFRRFEQHNSVDRERFPRFDDALRSAMFEEPIQFFLDVVRHDRSILDFIYSERTFVNRSLAEHYGLGELSFSEEWQEVPRADLVGRGGLLPMAVFLTQNAPGLRTSPVKRGYWVARRLLGERIPPPPPDVPDLPPDESLLGILTLRETLAKHRDHASCASCHNRIDSIGLVFESYGPIGELRSVDLGGQPVDTRGQFPDGSQRASVSGLRDYIREAREKDFISNLHRKLLSYGLSRSLQLSDEPLLQHLQHASAANHHSFHTLVQEIVASPQFLNKRGASGPPADLVSLEDTHE